METYADIADLRDRGVTEETATDEELEVALSRGTLLVESFCGRDFHLRTATVLLDGNGKETLFLEDRPIAVLRELWVDDVLVEEDCYRVYGEEGYIRLASGIRFPWSASVGVFPLGTQNVKVGGDFGYEAVPEDVKESCIILALRELKGLRGEAEAESGVSSGSVRRVKVDDISVDLDPTIGVETRQGLLQSTGDLKADRLLVKYRVKIESTAI